MHRDTAGSYLNQGLDDPGLLEIASIHSLWAAAWSVSKTPTWYYMLITAEMEHLQKTVLGDCWNASVCSIFA